MWNINSNVMVLMIRNFKILKFIICFLNILKFDVSEHYILFLNNLELARNSNIIF